MMSTTGKKWVFRNLGGTVQARGLIPRRLSNSNPARPYICHFSIFRRFTFPSTTSLLRLLVWLHILLLHQLPSQQQRAEARPGRLR